MKTYQFIILPFFLPTLSASHLHFLALLFFGASILLIKSWIYACHGRFVFFDINWQHASTRRKLIR